MSLASIFGWEQEEKQLVGVNFIDFSQIVISTVTATYKPTEVVDVDLMRALCLNSLRYNIMKNKQRYPTTIICVDNAENGYWRRDLAYYYKKNRGEARTKDKRDWTPIFAGMATVIAELKEHMPYIVIDIDKTEADDSIAVLVKHISGKFPNCQMMITSADGDFTQLHKFPHVKQYSPMGKKWVLPEHGSARNDLRFKIVKGDRKDGISTIMECSDWNFVKPEGKKAKAVNTVNFLDPILKADNPLELEFLTEEQKVRYQENEKLLDFDLIPDNIAASIIDAFDTCKPAGRSKIYPYFVKNRMIKLIDSINDF